MITAFLEREDVRDAFDGEVYYGKDAFEGLSIMTALAEGRVPEGQERTAARPRETGSTSATAESISTAKPTLVARR